MDETPNTDDRKPHRRRDDNLTVEPPDGGWAWMVLAGTFSSQVLVFGFYASAAVYVPPWIDFFDSSATETSLVVSLSSFFLGFWSVAAGVLITRFGVRSVWIAGGLLSSAGLVISAFATNTLYLTLVMSLVSALGFSMCVNCGFVVLGIYFKKRLTLAVGIASSGFAAGQVALTPLLDYLINEYGWRGSLVIFGGIMLHGIAAGALVRPLPPKARKQRLKSKKEFETKTTGDVFAQKSSESGDFIDRDQSRTGGDPTFRSDSPTDDDSVRVCFNDKEVLWRKTNDEDKATGSKTETSNRSVAYKSTAVDSDPRDICSVTDSEVAGSPETSNPPLAAPRCDPNPSLTRRCRRHLSHFRSFMLDEYGLSGLFHNPSFLLTLPIGVAHGCGWGSVVFLLAARAKSVGLQPTEGAMLLTLMGVGAFVASISHGWFVDKGYISPIIAYISAILCNLLGAFILSSLVTFGPMIAASVLFGTATGVAEPLIFVILQVLVQPSEVAGATSIFLVCWGLGEIIGATLTGLIYDTLASYNNAYFMSGSVFAIAAILATVVYILEKRNGKKPVSETDGAGTGEAEQMSCIVSSIEGYRHDNINTENRVVNPLYSEAPNNGVREIHSGNTAEPQDKEMTESNQGNKDESSC